MKIIEPSAEILYPNCREDIQEMYKRIERAGRTCYKSEDKITPESAGKFITGLVKRGHEAMIEHGSMTVKFIVDRGVSHEIVRHRIASFAQESSRYCNYSQDKFGNELTFIKPFFWDKSSEMFLRWKCMMRTAEVCYLVMLDNGATPEQARSVLPNSLKTELIMTANLREWRHFLQLRAAGTTGKPHPQMAEVAVPLLKQCRELMPEVFGDIELP